MDTYIRGCAWEGTPDVAYPAPTRSTPGASPPTRGRRRSSPWVCASSSPATRPPSTSSTAPRQSDMGYRGDGAGRSFELWHDGACVSSVEAVLGAGVARLTTGEGDGPCIVYLPEGMRPDVRSITAVGGSIGPAPAQPRWLVYGDSVAEGWVASGPSGAWPAVAGRALGLDVVNCGYAGSARGEIASAPSSSHASPPT